MESSLEQQRPLQKSFLGWAKGWTELLKVDFKKKAYAFSYAFQKGASVDGYHQ